MAPLKPDDVKRLEVFIKSCEKCPHLLWLPELKFFRDYIEGLGGTVPEAKDPSAGETPSTENKEEECKMDESTPDELVSEESEVELDNEGVIEPETVDPPELGDPAKVVTEDDEDAASEKRNEAVAAFSEGDFDKSVDLYTEAIKLNPSSAMLYAKRASVLLKQKRVKAALRDCDEALKLNPDAAAAYKFRGRAHRLLGNWLDAVKDLRLACRLDFDDVADEWLKEVQPNAAKLEEHQRKYGRKKLDKELKERQERLRKVKEEHKKAQEKENAKSSSFPDGIPDPTEGGAGGMPDFGDVFKDPEILAAMQDPEVAAAFQDVSSNPANIFKYQGNPKVSAVIDKLVKKFGGGGMPGGMGGMPGGMGGMPGGLGGMPGGFGGMPGGFGGMGGMPGGFPNATPPSSSPGDDLD